MTEIKLFVCCHKEVKVPKHPLLIPTQVGTALAVNRFSDFLHDDTGDNISVKNRSYCELTAQYWAWKNIEADYYGFFHYRRYLYPDTSAKYPYCIKREATCTILDKLGYKGFADLIKRYDIIVPKIEDMHISVREHYAYSPFHNVGDLKLAEHVVQEQSPEMAKALEQYLSGTGCYFGNIYIMRREIFFNYCEWLFPILEVFDQQADTYNYNDEEKRVDGYLAERLLGGYVTFQNSKIRTLELPRVHFHNGMEYVSKQMLNIVLPPGSWRRSAIKLKRIRGRTE